MSIVSKNKSVLFIIIIFSIFTLKAFALENINKADVPNIPSKYIDELEKTDLSLDNLKTINQQIKEYKLSEKEINDYIKKITIGGDDGAYPQDKNGNTLTPYGIVPKTSSVWEDEINAEKYKVGDVIGKFKKTNESIEVHNTQNGKTTYIPAYTIDGDNNGNYCCLEDLTNCGYSHNWDANKRLTTMIYTGKNTGLSKLNKTSGSVYYSDIKTIIKNDENEYEIKSYNVGGYSLINIAGLDSFLQVKVIEKNQTNTSNNTSNNSSNTVVNVSIPSFKVTLNGEIMDNEYNKYPLLVYKDITYFPMTYNGARFLGLKANWYQNSKIYNNKGVLFVGICPKNEIQSKLKIEKNQIKNASIYSANIADYGLALNTIEPKNFIKNASEKYPILNFRGISYFPLTWRYAVDEFGWTYSYTNQDGLIINSGNSFKPVIDDKVIGY